MIKMFGDHAIRYRIRAMPIDQKPKAEPPKPPLIGAAWAMRGSRGSYIDARSPDPPFHPPCFNCAARRASQSLVGLPFFAGMVPPGEPESAPRFARLGVVG